MRALLILSLIISFSITSFAQVDDGRLVTVPVIFHIVYTDTLPDNGMSSEVRNSLTGNSTTKLPREKILAELADLEKDFSSSNEDISEVIPEYKNVIGHPNIHFILKEIIYISTTSSRLSGYNNLATLQALSPTKLRDSCLNVYISTLRFRGRGSEGVTTVPIDEIDLNNDVVNLNYSWVGLHYRLLSHEVGHWLGLWHVDDKNQLVISKINDIPVQTALTDKLCVKCARKTVKVIASQRAAFTNPNTNNFMDYSGCRRMFSKQQSSYMRQILIRLRKAIWNGSASS